MKPKDYFAVIVGSGFSGSLLAWILQKHGKEVLLFDRDAHPRFAIGESTTPTADFFVRYLADRWGLKNLWPLSAYGPWRRAYPELACGKKRGFAYYSHSPGKRFEDDDRHSNSLLVAASSSDEMSDTHWFRSHVDQWIYRQAIASGVCGYERTQIESAEYEPSAQRWQVGLRREQDTLEIVRCNWVIDASGGSANMRHWLGIKEDSDWMRTRTGTLFGHFEGIASFSSETPSCAADAQSLFDGDDAAQHHIVDNGWYWALRFCNNITSFGLVLPEQELSKLHSREQAQEFWNFHVARYPSIAGMLRTSRLIMPTEGVRMVRRMSRCNRHALGPGWVSLPVAYGFVDPLHSTGIAHALSGVARLSEAFLASSNCDDALCKYARQLRNEIEWLDTVVGICYRGLPSFERFTALASFYFAAAIGFERDVVRDPMQWPRGYMLSNELGLRQAAESIYGKVSMGGLDESGLTQRIRESIKPWNSVGLLDPCNQNRLAHTAASK